MLNLYMLFDCYICCWFSNGFIFIYYVVFKLKVDFKECKRFISFDDFLSMFGFRLICYKV